MKGKGKEGFNFADAELIIAAQKKIEALPVGQIRVSGCGIYIPQWIFNDPNRKEDTFNVLIDQAKKVLLLKPSDNGKHPFTRLTKKGKDMPGIFRSKRLFTTIFPREELTNTSRIFECDWSKEHDGYIVNLNAEIKPKESE